MDNPIYQADFLPANQAEPSAYEKEQVENQKGVRVKPSLFPRVYHTVLYLCLLALLFYNVYACVNRWVLIGNLAICVIVSILLPIDWVQYHNQARDYRTERKKPFRKSRKNK